MITYTSVKEFNQVSQMKYRTHAFLHIADVFLRNKNRLVLILLDTCSYIDRLGSVDSPRPRNHPFKGDGKFNPLSLFTSVGLRFASSRSSLRAKNFLPIEETRLRYTSSMYFQRTLKAALISSYIKQHCVKTGTIIMSYQELTLHRILSPREHIYSHTAIC